MTITATPRLGLNKWGAGTDPFTRAQNNADHDAVELLTAIDVQGIFSARPAPGVVGRYYFATDTVQLFREDGTTWREIALTNPYRARLYATVAHAIPNNAFTVLPFDGRNYDPNNNSALGAAAGYTCPVPGYYSVKYAYFAGNSGSPFVITAAIWVNGTEWSRAPHVNTAGVVPGTGSSDDVHGSAGDLIQIAGFQNSGGPLNTANANPVSYMSVSFLSR